MVEILKRFRNEIGGVIHCSGGAQTKILHFVDNLRIVKDNLFEIPPLFKLIQAESGTDWKEMYKVFNMGHRMEIYADKSISDAIISISHTFGVPAQIIGHVENSEKKELSIETRWGNYQY